MTMTTELWRPVGLQVACQVALSPVPSGGACQVSGDPLKVPSEGPAECKSFRVTCKHAYCVSARGGMHGCDPPPRLRLPSLVPNAAQTLLSLSYCVISPSSACRAILPVVSVPRQFVGSRPRTVGRRWCVSTPTKALSSFSEGLALVSCGCTACFLSSGIFDDWCLEFSMIGSSPLWHLPPNF